MHLLEYLPAQSRPVNTRRVPVILYSRIRVWDGSAINLYSAARAVPQKENLVLGPNLLKYWYQLERYWYYTGIGTILGTLLGVQVFNCHAYKSTFIILHVSVQPELSRIVAILRFAVHALSMRSI